MSKQSWWWSLAAVALVAPALAMVPSRAAGADAKANVKKVGSSILAETQTGNPGLKSVGKISFGPDGLLLIAEPSAASLVAIDTGDGGPAAKFAGKVENFLEVVAGALGAKAEDVEIVDMAVNPASGKLYFSVNRKADKTVAILTVNAEGKLANFDLSKVSYVRVTLPGGADGKVKNITDVAFANDRILAAGQSNEEFASKIYSIPLPLTSKSSANMFSAETYHVAHGRWETKAPIQSFIPLDDKGEPYIVGSFACTPIVKFPLANLSSGAQVKGTSVLELGSGNRPLDMFSYEKDGKKWIVTNTYRMPFKSDLFGNSRYWGVRVSMDFLSAEQINEKAVTRDIKSKSGPNGVEVLDALSGAVQVTKIDEAQIAVLRDADGKLNLEVADLP